MAYLLDLTLPLAAEIHRVADEQLGSALTWLASAGDAERGALSIHETRKAMKSLRALLRLVRYELSPAVFAREDAAFRELARSLAAVREAAAAEAALTALAAITKRELPSDVWDQARCFLRARAPASAAAGPTPEASALAAAQLGSVRARVATWTLDHDGWRALATGIRRNYARGRAELRFAHAAPTTANLHQFRKRVKYHQYQIRLLRGLWDQDLSARRDALDELGELLGDDHDLAALEELLCTPLATGDAVRLGVAEHTALLLALQDRRAELQRRAFLLGDRLYCESPRRFARRLAVYHRTGYPSGVAAATKLP